MACFLVESLSKIIYAKPADLPLLFFRSMHFSTPTWLDLKKAKRASSVVSKLRDRINAVFSTGYSGAGAGRGCSSVSRFLASMILLFFFVVGASTWA